MPLSRARGLHGHVVEELGARIATGVLEAGTRLVPEELAEGFGVSRTVIREGLRVLQAKGLVAARQRVGTVVRPAEAWDALDRDVIRWNVRGPGRARQLRDLLQLRGVIEPTAARLAATAPLESGLEEMRGTVTAMREAAARRDARAFTDADTLFHTLILRASGNSAFAQLAEALYALFTVRVEEDLLPDVIADEVLAAHERLLDSIVAGNGDDAQSASAWLIEESCRALQDEIEDVAGTVLSPAGLVVPDGGLR